MLLLALLIVPLVVARPFSLVGAERPRATSTGPYFTADYVWRRAVVAELAKGDFLPANPFYVGDVLHYYWLPHLLSAVEYRAWGTTIEPRQPAPDPLGPGGCRVRGRALRHGPAGGARVPWAALAGVLWAFLVTSFEGARGAVGHCGAVECR